MYDPITSSLIQSTPELPGLERDKLPEKLSRSFAEIVSARVLLRDSAEKPKEILKILDFARRLARTNETLVSIEPEREDRIAASFVAATAYQLVHQINNLHENEKIKAFIGPEGISSEISAMLLFLIADSTADASEVAQSIQLPKNEPLQIELIDHLILLAKGQVGNIVKRKRPSQKKMVLGSGFERANAALYYRILRGVRALAFALQGRSISGFTDPISVFSEVKTLASPGTEENFADFHHESLVVFPGPYQLASLLVATGTALLDGAVISLAPPTGVAEAPWRNAMKSVAETRPYLWRNHKDAVNQGYLNNGISSAIAFPTGAGKSTTAQLKIHSTLLSGHKAVFLAPTHALVDQTTRDLRKAFPSSSVQGERADEFLFLEGKEHLPDIMVMTPEACLLLTHMEPDQFSNVGLLIFDECHLMHPKTYGDRRAIDAMLCIVGFVRVAPKADIVLLSAMMKNSEEISKWLANLTQRKALSLDNAWKPTRQLRGCIVYDIERLRTLESKLRKERIKKPTGGIPAEVSRKLSAHPAAFFSVKQTWASKVRRDYALVPFSREALLLATNPRWGLTPNSGVVASSIAASAVKAGLRTLIFSQSIPNAVSIAEKAAKKLDVCDVILTESEKRLYNIAVDEMGGAEQLYITIKNEKLSVRATCHHGQLLPEERHLAESLYKRDGALSILAATPTLGQGMNLPADFVIIAEDSQFNTNSGRRDILKPEELLNAAGRAGRAGESATGIVLVIPGKVVGVNDAENKIGNRWTSLRDIFGQSDQCLIIDDPLTALMDRIHSQTDEIGDLERYVVARLADTKQDDSEQQEVRHGLARSFAAFRKQQAGEEEWIRSRTTAALEIMNNNDKNTIESQPLRDLTSILGIPEDILLDLTNALIKIGFNSFNSVIELLNWMFNWLQRNPTYMLRLLKIENIEYLFGTDFKELKDDKQRANYALPRIQAALVKWMNGATLKDIQTELSLKKRDLKHSTSARKFVIRIVPDIAHLLSAPLQILLRSIENREAATAEINPVLLYSNRSIRQGFASAEITVYAAQNSSERWSRRETHKAFSKIVPYLSKANVNENKADLETRIQNATRRIT
ncbi:DEAD/DEAH box helicase [Yersinia massiliensis]|uniref:DEAD/DEAH box helicase n=1 Tax=Yersinia massiliensis TaxID=419257 RepID=UPI0003134547|nr:DEAD/DEAH box helicase [Yersinia massiliensis]